MFYNIKLLEDMFINFHRWTKFSAAVISVSQSKSKKKEEEEETGKSKPHILNILQECREASAHFRDFSLSQIHFCY